VASPSPTDAAASPETSAPSAAPIESAPAAGAAETAPPAQPDPVEKLQAEAASWKDKCLRAHAEMDNLRKRLAREKQEAIEYANEGFLHDLLPIVDNLELALQSMEQSDNIQTLKEGVGMVLSQLHQTLKKHGVDHVEAIGKPFDYHAHEAVSQVESDQHPEGTVIHQTRKGYKLKGRLLRPAGVVVSKPPEKGS